MSGKLEDQVAIVTCADLRIGQAIAVQFAREGADLAITWRQDEQGAAETRRRIVDCGRRVFVHRTDLHDAAQVAALFEQTRRTLGTPDILVNSAGEDCVGPPLAEMPYEDWDARLRNHLYGPFYCCQQFVRARRAGGGGGHIVNVGALHRVLPRAGTGAYDAADGGLRHLVRSLALELAPDGIGVNHVAPGEGLSAMKRVAQPQDIARLVLFLVSDEGAYANGQAYAIV